MTALMNHKVFCKLPRGAAMCEAVASTQRCTQLSTGSRNRFIACSIAHEQASNHPPRLSAQQRSSPRSDRHSYALVASVLLALHSC